MGILMSEVWEDIYSILLNLFMQSSPQWREDCQIGFILSF